jgi:Fe2+ or Zn2+ uptake regulation protein
MVFETVQESRSHPTADEIYLRLRADHPRISRGTVYRNLNVLAEQGEVRPVAMPDADRFDWRTERHYHLRCKRCGLVVDAPLTYQAEMDNALTDETGFAIDGHVTVFEGLCPRCQVATETGADKA